MRKPFSPLNALGARSEASMGQFFSALIVLLLLPIFLVAAFVLLAAFTFNALTLNQLLVYAVLVLAAFAFAFFAVRAHFMKSISKNEHSFSRSGKNI